ncbi:MAG: MurR/RpiR family transcriptional regulator [Negativicutes bacterium]|nr:MurR/RpiR family transcriptional regulator [Negativicutes bacterium]
MKKNLLQRLQQETARMTPSQRRVADYILKNPVDSSFLTLDELSSLAATSTTTVMRFAVSLGFSGYAEFQKDLQELLRDRVAPPTRLEINTKDLRRNSLFLDCVDVQLANIKKTVGFLSDDDLDHCLNLIQAASTVYIVGMRSSFAVAYHLHHGLNQVLGNCKLLKADSGDNIDDIININQSDLVIAITFPRYARQAIDLVTVMKGFGPKVIAITDGYQSPLAPLSDLVLPCAFHSLAFHNSIVAQIFLADFLITAIAVREPSRTKKRLEAAEGLFKNLHIHIDG